MIAALLAANSNPWKILAAKIGFMIFGLVMLFVGYYAIKNKRLLISKQQKRFMKLFGKEEITGKWATIGGVVQVLLGIAMLAFPLIAPSFGILTDLKPLRRSSKLPDMHQFGRMRQDRPFDEPQEEHEPLPELDLPEEDLPFVDAGQNGLFRSSTAMLGNGRLEEPFSDLAPEGGVMVGLRAYVDDDFSTKITAMVPVYQLLAEYHSNDLIGVPSGKLVESIAKPGFVVGGARVSIFSSLSGIQLRFYPLTEDGALGDASEAYWGDWIGRDRRSQTVNVGAPVLGINGSLSDFGGSQIEHLSLVYLSEELIRLSEPAEFALPVIPTAPSIERIPLDPNVRGTRGSTYQDNGTAGAIMVGLQVAANEEGISRITSMRPIYQNGDRYQLGSADGDTGGGNVMLARPGYALGGLRYAKLGRGIQLVFMRVASDGSLDPSDQYEGEWVGANVNTQEWLSQGNPLVGLSFSRPHDRLYSLILDVAKLTTNTRQSGVTDETGVTDATNATSAESEPETTKKKLVRTWTSRSGKQMQAEFLSYDPETQKLTLHRLADDKKVTIAVTVFSDDDQAFIEELVAAKAE